MFDTDVNINDVKSPTKEVEKIEQAEEGKEVNYKTYNPNEPEDEEEEKKPKSKLREAVEFLIPIVVAVIIAIILKSVVFANAVVPTGSMLNTIHEGDRIIASRLAYINEDPQRYDVIIFKYPDDETQIYVKRVIGLPGETVQVVNGVVYVTKTDGETIQLDDSFVTNGTPEGDFGPFEVPADSYFMMGDNRNSSWDSRFWNNKFVNKEKILGKVKFKYYPSFGKIE
ncbi:MAG: signal peptidase I [Eubacterium sp.]|nr:signal peptidase I [Eubacterium sp.]